MRLTRREFNRLSAMAGIACLGDIPNGLAAKKSLVAIAKASDRRYGIPKAVALLGGVDVQNKDVYLKGNYNSPDPFPATTHPDALQTTVELLSQEGARRIILVERSGMGDTRQILEKLQAAELLRKLGAGFLPLEEMEAEAWIHKDLSGSHWVRGVEAPCFLVEDACVVQICNLNMHRFGGQFSASLKNSIGLIAKYGEKGMYNYMKELHTSPDQCQMIAEVNQLYSPELVIMDAIQSFIIGGPESGESANPEILLASRDRVALDAVGMAILQHYGAEAPLRDQTIFDQGQIKRAVELGLGAQSAEEISLVADDRESRSVAAKLESLLKKDSGQ
jgi:uncharacterized protein (DUF362 family)